MAPKVIRPIPRQRLPKHKILQLREIQQRRRLQDRDPVPAPEQVVVDVEGVSGREEVERVGVHGAAVVEDYDVGAGPAGGDVAED